MCPKQVHEGSSDLLMFLSVVMIDWGDLRGQILTYFPALGSPLVGRCAHCGCKTMSPAPGQPAPIWRVDPVRETID